MAEIVLAQANPARLFEGVSAPEFREDEIVRFLDPRSPNMSVFDLGLIRGDGIFEATTMIGRVPLAIKLHIRRLARSAEMLDMPEFVSDEAWLEAIEAVIERYGDDQLALVKIMVSRGYDGSVSAGRELGPGVPSVWIFIDPITRALLKDPEIKAVLRSREVPVAAAERSPWLLLGAKTLSYAYNMAAYREAARSGVGLVIFTSSDGYVYEGATSSIVIMKDGALKTPPANIGILHGTTQQELFAFAAHEEIPHEYGLIAVEELLSADHVFNMGGSGVQCVSEIDGKEFVPALDFMTKANEFMRTERQFIEDYTLQASPSAWY